MVRNRALLVCKEHNLVVFGIIAIRLDLKRRQTSRSSRHVLDAQRVVGKAKVANVATIVRRRKRGLEEGLELLDGNVRAHGVSCRHTRGLELVEQGSVEIGNPLDNLGIRKLDAKLQNVRILGRLGRLALICLGRRNDRVDILLVWVPEQKRHRELLQVAPPRDLAVNVLDWKVLLLAVRVARLGLDAQIFKLDLAKHQDALALRRSLLLVRLGLAHRSRHGRRHKVCRRGDRSRMGVRRRHGWGAVRGGHHGTRGKLARHKQDETCLYPRTQMARRGMDQTIK